MRNTTFRGIRPKAMDDTLENNFASYASNCLLHNGAIRPLNAPRYEGQVVDTDGRALDIGIKKVHIAGDMVVGFKHDTFVAPDSLLRGGEDSFLFTKDGKLWRSSPLWIIDHQGAVEVGICPPNEPPTIAVSGGKCSPSIVMDEVSCVDQIITGTCQDNRLTFAFAVTYVSACHEESAPSYPSQAIDIASGDEVIVIAHDTPPLNAVARRWYVSIAIESTAQWFFVAETPIDQVVLQYCHGVWAFNEIMQSTDYNPPPTCLEGVSIVGDSTTVVWSGKDIWFSEPNQPHAYPMRYRQRIEDDIVAIIPLNLQSLGRGVPYANVILTRNRPYLMRGNLPESVEITRLNRVAPCLNPMGVLAYEGDVFFANDEGIFRVTEATVYDVTNEWFTKMEWSTIMDATAISIGYYNDRIFAFGKDRDGLMIRYTRENNQYQFDAVYLTPVYEAVAVGKGGVMYVVDSQGKYYSWEQADDKLICRWRSKQFTHSGLSSPTSAKVIADTHDFTLGQGREAYSLMELEQADCRPFYDVDRFLYRHPEYLSAYSYLHAQQIQFTLYADDKLAYRRIVKSQKPFRIKRNRRKIYWSYEVQTQTPIREIHAQTSFADLTNEGGHA